MWMGVIQHQHMLTVALRPFAAFWCDDDGAERSFWLLKVGMAVIPIGSALYDWEAVGERLSRLNPVKANGRNTVLLIRQDQAMPVD